MKSQVIKVKNEAEFQQSLQYWESQGWSCVNYKYDPKFPYLGVVDNAFGMWAAPMGAEIITLPPATPKHGDEILVWDDNESQADVMIFSSMGHEKEIYPVRCLYGDVEDGKYDTMSFKHWKPIPAKRKLTIQQIAEKFGIAADQIEII